MDIWRSFKYPTNSSGDIFCPKCEKYLPKSEFHGKKRSNGVIGRFTVCKPCHNKECRDNARSVKLRILDIYGTSCECCGEAAFEFLSIDHINRDGGKERKLVHGQNFYYSLLKLKEKRADLRVLCMNCNFALGKFGYCPHEKR